MISQKECIKYYCKDAEEIAVSLYNIKGRKVYKRKVELSKILKEFNKEDYKNYEVLRSVTFKDGKLLFIYDIDFHGEDEPIKGILNKLKYIRNIEKIFPNTFSWKFSGRGFHGVSIINPNNPFYKYKFKDVFHFYKSLIRHLDRINDLKTDVQYVNKNGLNKSIGSINLNNYLYCIPISPLWSPLDIYQKSVKCVIDEKLIKFKTLDFNNFINIVRPINISKINFTLSKEEVNSKTFPPCISTMLNKKSLRNDERFDLIRYFKVRYDHKQILEIFKRCASERTYEHLKNGDCDGQIGYILSHDYGPPNCLTGNLSNNCNKKICKRVHPLK